MSVFMAIFNFIISGGPTVLLPIIMLVVGLVFRVKLKDAIIGALTVGVGYQGLKIIVKFLTSILGPASQSMVDRFHMKMNVLDIGFGATAALGWAGGGSLYIVGPIVLCVMLVNIGLFAIKRTNTLSIDIWNYHHILTICALLYAVTNNMALICLAAIFAAIVGFKLSDWASPMISKYFKIEGVTTPAFSATAGMFLIPMNWLLDQIPGFKNINVDMSTIQKRLGIISNTTVLGFILGVAMGFLADYNALQAVNIGISMATVMVVLPKMTHLFVEGVKPISNQVKSICDAKFKGRKILIGLDPSILVGDPTVLTVSILMIPTTIIIAVLLPGNVILPFADLGAIVFKEALIVAFCGGNMLRAYIISIVFTIFTLMCGSDQASLVSKVLNASGLTEGHSGMISSMTGTAMPISWTIFQAFNPNGIGLYITIPAIIILFMIIWFVVERFFVNSKSEFIVRNKK